MTTANLAVKLRAKELRPAPAPRLGDRHNRADEFGDLSSRAAGLAVKALMQYRATPGFERLFRAGCAAHGLAPAVIDEDDEAAFFREAPDTEVFAHILKPITAAMMDQAPRLKLIQKIGVGVNTIDLDAAQARGVAVCNMPGTNSAAVAELTLALIFAVLRRIVPIDRETRAGRGWSLDPAAVDSIGEIGGRTIGFVGFGAVPQRLAPVLKALGARVVYTATAPKADVGAEFRPLDALLSESDIISLHVPLTEATRGLIDARALALMPPGAILINTARGDLVDEAALSAALAEGRLGGAGLDVFQHEPVGAGHALAKFDTVVMSPHLAWLTPETLQRSLPVLFENARRVQVGAPLLHRVV